ncbi:MAG: polyprenol phosphomannose-dependent alpha 1,6 mannosyltransferase MptB, partial [Marmoricola sp.]
TGAHLAIGLGLSALGPAILTWAWWDLRALAVDRVEGVRLVRRAATWWAVPLLAAPPLFSGDGWSYVATGVLTGRGFSPYTYAPELLEAPLRSGVNGRWLATPSPYGPLALGWGAVWSHLTSDPWLLLVCYRLFALVGLALLAWAVPRLALRSGLHPGKASWLVVASPFVIAHGVGGLHNDVVVAGFGAAALALTDRRHWILGAALAGAAASVKVPGGLVAVGVVLLSLEPASTVLQRVGRAVQVGGAAGAVLIGLGWAAGTGTGWVKALTVPTTIPSKLSLSHDLGVLIGSIPGLGPGATVSFVQSVAVAGMALTAVLLVLVHRRRDEATVLASVAVFMLGVTVFSPAVHYWYLLWCLPLLGCVPISRSWRAATVAATAVLGLTAFVDPSLHLPFLTAATRWSLVLVPLAAGFAVRGQQPGPAPVEPHIAGAAATRRPAPPGS